MDLKEVKAVCQEIVEKLTSSTGGTHWRKYETFLDDFGMLKRRNPARIKQIDRQLKKKQVTFWVGKEQVDSVGDLQRGETITFRIVSPIENGGSVIINDDPFGKRIVKSEYAGKIKVDTGVSGITLFKHQGEAGASLTSQIITKNKLPFAGLLVLPTGGGKTLTAVHWLIRNFLDKGKKILWIAHRHELLEQALSTFHRLAYSDIFKTRESFNYRIISGLHDKPVHIMQTDDLIVGSKDSMIGGIEYLKRNWLQDNPEVFLVIDEAHHATAKTYRRLIHEVSENVSSFRMLGLTATPFRVAEGERGLLGKVFLDDIVYKIDLRTLINQGILSQPIFEEAQTNFDTATLNLSEKQLENLKYFDIDSIGSATARTIAENRPRNLSIVDRYVGNKGNYKQTIVFALNQDNAIALKALFIEKGVKADWVLSSIRDIATGATISTKENKQKLEDFRSGKLEVLINVNILTEGVDVPNVQSVFLARPTISPILMTQMIGRGLRGVEAGGTKDAYIVSFIDQWQDKVAWVNPESVIDGVNTDFSNPNKDTAYKTLRLVSIQKIEEFALLSDPYTDPATRKLIEQLDFIERVPVGIYYFPLLERIKGESRERNCEVLIYNNMSVPYMEFVSSLPSFFNENNLRAKDNLSVEELEDLSLIIEDKFFSKHSTYHAYRREDIKDVLQFFAQSEAEPEFIPLQDRDSLDITNIAREIVNGDLRVKERTELQGRLWEDNETKWKAFFGYDKHYYLREIELAVQKLTDPDMFKVSATLPIDDKEDVQLESLSMSDIRRTHPIFWKYLSDQVYQKHTDEDGFFVSATKEYKSKRKLDFHIDHIIPLSKGGKTTLDNLQLLTRRENAKKGAK